MRVTALAWLALAPEMAYLELLHLHAFQAVLTQVIVCRRTTAACAIRVARPDHIKDTQGKGRRREGAQGADELCKAVAGGCPGGEWEAE